jgi:serine/threonine protein kinase
MQDRTLASTSHHRAPRRTAAGIDGVSLRRLVELGRVPSDIVLRIVLDASLGLAAIYCALDASDKPLGLVHRDVCPENIVLGKDGISRLSGTAIVKHADNPMCRETIYRGKHDYMAPEYLVDPRSTPSGDLFALGVVLWEMLAGRRRVTDDAQLEIVRATTGGEAPSLVAEGVPPAIDAVIHRATMSKLAERPMSVRDFARRLERAAEGKIATHAEVAAFVRAQLAASNAELCAPDAVIGRTRTSNAGRRSVWTLLGLALVSVAFVGSMAAVVRAGRGTPSDVRVTAGR